MPLPYIIICIVDYCSAKWDTGGRAVLDKNSIVTADVIKAVAVYFCLDQTVEVQLWQQVGELEYKVLWKWQVHPPRQLPGRTLVCVLVEYTNENDTLMNIVFFLFNMLIYGYKIR